MLIRIEGEEEDGEEFGAVEDEMEDLEMMTDAAERQMNIFTSQSDPQQPSFGDIVFEKIEKLKKIKK